MTLTVKDLAARMAGIDFAMLVTRTDGGRMASRPMSNNGDVDYAGDSYFFTYDGSRTVADVTADAQVGLTMQGPAGSGEDVGRPPLFIAVQGRAALIRDKALFAVHWLPELERWFAQGVDTPGLVLVHVRAERIHYWDGEDEGDVQL